MEYKEIVAVTGLSGLYQLLSTKSDGAIVRNIEDKVAKFISARQHNVTPLDSIEVYTTGENVRLQQVFEKMEANEAAIPPVNPKESNNAIRQYFKSVYPEFDEERVYVSDMKKMLKWYEVLKSNDLLKFETQTADSESPSTDEGAPAPADEAAQEQPLGEEPSAEAAPSADNPEEVLTSTE
jgi:Domain of unknown function (DUF5606)